MEGEVGDLGCGASLFQPRRTLETRMPSCVHEHVSFCAEIILNTIICDLLVANLPLSSFNQHKREKLSLDHVMPWRLIFCVSPFLLSTYSHASSRGRRSYRGRGGYCVTNRESEIYMTILGKRPDVLRGHDSAMLFLLYRPPSPPPCGPLLLLL
jgi:hypothetical protein